jgi:hypothetical protein
VGWFDRLKPSAAPLPDADAAMPRWARITRIDREDGPLATVERADVVSNILDSASSLRARTCCARQMGILPVTAPAGSREARGV